MAEKIQNGQAEYGVIHASEEKMRAAGQGVFEGKKAKPASSKMEAASADKAKPISRATMTTKSSNNKTAGKKAKK